MKNEPRTLIWDIETSLMPVAVFQLAGNDWIDPSSILSERYIICGSWKLLGEDKIYSVAVTDDSERYSEDPHDDFHVVETLHKVLSEADVVIHHNGNSFDWKYLETRALYHGLGPLPPVTLIDTYRVAKSKLLLASNKLDYLGGLLKVGKKIKTSPGLWMRVLNGEKKAVKEMVEYNKQDVVLLEKVFDKLKGYIPNALNRELFGQKDGCPRCGSRKVQSRGVHRAISRIYQRWQCQGCLGWFKTALADAKVRTRTRIL